MKKKKLKTLTLNKKAISVFNTILGGRANCSMGETCNDDSLEPIQYTDQDVSWCWE